MKTLTDSGKVEEYQGTVVNPPVSYEFSYEVFENLQEAKNSEDWPGDSEVLKFVNQRKFTSSKAQAYQKATKSLKETYESSDAFKRKNLINSAIAAGLAQQEAEVMADSILARGAKK